MSRSILLQLARDSIQEVLQAKKIIDKESLLQKHPLLNQKIKTTINLLINKELKGSYSIQNQKFSLLKNIILSAKRAVFENEENQALTISEYLHCEIELIIDTEDGEIIEIDPSII